MPDCYGDVTGLLQMVLGAPVSYGQPAIPAVTAFRALIRTLATDDLVVVDLPSVQALNRALLEW